MLNSVDSLELILMVGCVGAVISFREEPEALEIILPKGTAS